MKINSSNVVIAADREYYKKIESYTEQTKHNTGTGKKTTIKNYIVDEFKEDSFNLTANGGEVEYDNANQRQKTKDKEGIIYSLGSMSRSSAGMIGNFEISTVNKMLQVLLDSLTNKKSYGSFSFSTYSASSFSFAGFSLATGLTGRSGRGDDYVVEIVDTKKSVAMQESESLNVQGRGVVKTEDGRSINFSVEANMSRDFMTSASIEFTEKNLVLRDPLVINLDDMPADVSDVKFKFDIDADGTMDEISMLRGGSGFLALDRNGDGKINDGSELFGTQSGNGFEDLKEFDEDGNGWIDENDEIYDKLRVWVKDENGNDKLLTLKEADVGAIYLTSATGNYSLTDGDNNVNAVVRSTGVYLRESTGNAGTVQQLDFAAKA